MVPIATTGRVGGGTACEVEAMEGFGVLRAASLAGVPAVELRAVSNAVGERDRARWRIDDALAALAAAVPSLLDALELCLSCRRRFRRQSAPSASSSARRFAPTVTASGARYPLGVPLAVATQLSLGQLDDCADGRAARVLAADRRGVRLRLRAGARGPADR